MFFNFLNFFKCNFCTKIVVSNLDCQTTLKNSKNNSTIFNVTSSLLYFCDTTKRYTTEFKSNTDLQAHFDKMNDE